MPRTALPAVLAAAALLAAIPAAAAAEIVLPDGRRETVTSLHADKDGKWLAVREGRLSVLKPGEVVAVVDDEGKETSILPAVAEGPVPPEAEAALARLEDPKAPYGPLDRVTVWARPTRGLIEAFVRLAAHRTGEIRRRAVWALAGTRTLEGVEAAAKAVLAEKDGKARLEEASALLGVAEIFRRASCGESLKAGLADTDASVRVVFAHLAPKGDAAALQVLKKDGLGHSDHHFREGAAVELAERGDGSGERILISMLARDRLPGAEDPKDPSLQASLVREQVAICRLLRSLHTDAGKAALETATKCPREEVRKAAAAALKDW